MPDIELYRTDSGKAMGFTMNKLAIIGDPVSHSHSPKIHNFISKRLGLDYRYEILETPPGKLEDNIKLLKSEYAGFNVTSPYKIEVMSYLDEISPQAQRYGAVNTVVRKDGKLYGYNTDADGFFMSIPNRNVSDKNVLILGAGGAAHPVAMNLAERGAASVTILNRTVNKAEEIRDNLKKYGLKLEIEQKRENYDLIINCTTLGMGKNKDMLPPIDMSVIDKNTLVGDMIYNPEKTLFLQEAEKRGATIFNGLGMLVYQAVLAYEFFTDLKLDETMPEEIFKEVFGL